MEYDVVIIGAGPAGLSCGAITAQHSLSTLILERKKKIGSKVCAGGITWNGLIQRVGDISQQNFPKQYIFTKYQKAVIEEPEPIIATVNREELGAVMADKARNLGAELYVESQLVTIRDNYIEYYDHRTDDKKKVYFKTLVGADGSTSSVRRHLGLPVERYGVGINYQIPGTASKMEWHLNSDLFRSGYAWVFPHSETISIGAYANPNEISPHALKENLHLWGAKSGHDLSRFKPQAEKICYDYRGSCFGNMYLAGDAAGLASGLTGEGIYPAIVSGEYIGNKIVASEHRCTTFESLLKNHKIHTRAVQLAGRSKFLATTLSEITAFALKKGLLHFSTAEMARG